jgi:hypothetical protein
MFWGVSHRFVTTWKSEQNGPNWCNSCTTSCKEFASEIFTTNAPDPPHLTLISWFVAFRTVLLLHESRYKTRRTHTINAQVHATNSCRKFSQWTHPMHPHEPITHDLGCFAPFRYCSKVGTKWAELMQLMHKFVHRSCVGIFHNECTQSTPLGPKLMICGISQRFVTARKSVQHSPN